MDREEARALIDSYLERVAEVTEQLGALYGVAPQNLLRATREGTVPRYGAAAGLRFRFHGSGLCVHTGKRTVDFDWGRDGSLGGFDAGRLCGFSKTHKPFSRRTPQGYPLEEVTQALSEMENEGEVRRLGDLLFLQDPAGQRPT